MISRTVLWASENPRVEALVKKSRLTRPVIDRFVAGHDLEDAIHAIKELNSQGIGGILDLLGEGVVDPAGASSAAEDYLCSIRRIDETGIDTSVSVKLTQLGLAFDKGACIDHLRRLAAEAQAVGTRVEIDMEQSEYVTDTLDVYRVLRADFETLRVAVQVYLRRTPVDLQAMADLKPRIRLVKGAYAEPEELAFQKRAEIDAQYKYLIDWLFDRGTDPGIATHDGALIDHAKRAAARSGAGKQGFEFQMLYGVRSDLQRRLANDGYRMRTYVPFGSAWYPYLMRRLAERPANLRFFLRAVLRG
ncbi:MAG: proline dehydrogenase family protein [Actinomycetota bacterium]|nr:proline dehydrogenase family protein [Actinomycetota bacterium]